MKTGAVYLEAIMNKILKVPMFSAYAFADMTS